MKKILQTFLFIAILYGLNNSFILAQNSSLKLEEKLTFQIGKGVLESPFVGWLYLAKKQQVLVYEEDENRLYSLETGKLIKTLPPFKTGFSTRVSSLSPDEKRIIFYDYTNKGVELWDIENGKLISLLPKLEYRIRGVKWSADGRFFIFEHTYGVYLKENLIFDASSGKPATVIKTKLKADIKFSPDGTKVLTREHIPLYEPENLLKLWNAEDGTLINDFAFLGKSISLSAEFTPDGKNLLVHHANGQSQMIDLRMNEIKYSLSGRSIFFIPGKNLVASLKEDFRGLTKHDEITLEIYDLDTGKLLKEIKTGKADQHQVETNQIVLSPNGNTLATGGKDYSKDYEVEVWNIDDARSKFVLSSLVAKEYKNLFEGGYKQLDRISFSHNGKYLIARNSSSKKYQIRFWDAETGKLLENLTGDDLSMSLTDDKYLTKFSKKDSKITFYEIK